jgi:hypothetical protein
MLSRDICAQDEVPRKPAGRDECFMNRGRRQYCNPTILVPHFLDTFNDLSHWLALIGTAAAVANKLQGTTQGNQGNNLIVNGEFSINVLSWGVTSCAITRVDSEVDPGVNGGGVDKWCGKIVTDVSTNGYADQNVIKIIGARYNNTCRAYAPSANSTVKAAELNIAGTVNAVTAEDVWESLAVLKVATASNEWPLINNAGGADGDIAYFDRVQIYRQNTVYLLSSGLWNSPNATITVDMPQPAAPSVVPLGIIFRYTNALNYWELRINPNTAGTDTSIVEVVAGVETVRASADVDWSVGGQTDQVRIVLNGAVCTVTQNKNGAGWGAACSYATMATGLASSQLGIMLYDVTLGRVSQFEVTL